MIAQSPFAEWAALENSYKLQFVKENYGYCTERQK